MKISLTVRLSVSFFFVAVALWVTLDRAVAASVIKEGDWVAFGRDPGGSQHSPLKQIDTDNVQKLRQVWTHRSGDFIDAPSPKGSILQTTPLHVNGTLYFCTPFDRVFALEADTGRERWVFDPHRTGSRSGREASNPPRSIVSRCRGVAYWEAAATLDSKTPTSRSPCQRRIFKNGENARLYALDADTGALCIDFGAEKGHPGWVSHADYENYGEGMMASSTSPPAVLGDTVIAAMSVNDGIANAKDGIVRAFDARSGELRWEFNPIPPEFRAQSGAANVWSTISVDEANNLVFLPTTSPSTDYYGGGRRFEIPLANAIVALDGTTGKVVWSRQVVRHDLFDYDLVGHPLLVDIRRDGRTVEAALLQSKMGWLYGFDRRSGESLWPITELTVPASDIPGEAAAPMQPVPKGMAPFARQTLKREDLFGITPIDAYACKRRFDELRYEGMYTPPSARGSILFPSALGGGNWGGAAYDPATNSLIIKAENLATILRVIAKKDPTEDQQPPKNYLTRPLVGTPYRIEGELFSSPLGVPCTPPPWGTLMSLDLGTGQPRWEMPLGQIRRAGVTVPKGAGWGSPNVAGPITTAGGLVFIGATMDSKLRALDTRSGKELWSAELPVPGMAVPMTYLVNGKQYVVIAAGGNAQVGTPIGDYLIAYALPD
ncbi:MAG: pyrroloquinoline quinone-dependent dehydrogenase [Gammaproteobacteria bacterium]|nr:pyrroloquinoline quinone-dependent dehydrogenase [Gammaproteobacteria bacterium]MBM4217377.1 pyrroloquinoline quinone-dependent dehydrogenase [Gammaproteobacteria bacterium]